MHFIVLHNMGFTPYKYFNGTRFINKMLTLFRLGRNKVNTKDSQQEALVNSPQAETFEQGTKSRHKIKTQNQDTNTRQNQATCNEQRAEPESE